MMLAEERKRKIVELVNKNKIIKVTELSQLLDATEATIRRDLDELQERKKVRRIHGGAISVKPVMYTGIELSHLCMAEKKRIAKKAYEFVDDNDTLLIDGSTTVFELIKLIAEGEKKGLSILTNSFNVVTLLERKKDIQIFHMGGKVDYRMNYAVGTITESILQNLRADKSFLGTNGIEPNFGYSVPSFEDASVKKAMLHAANQNFILADHSKFGESYLAKITEFTGTVDYLITDYLPDGIDRETVEAGVNLIEVGPVAATEGT